MRIAAGSAALGLVLLAGLAPAGAPQDRRSSNDNVVLVTFDGARVQEIFGGLDIDVLRSTLKEGQTVQDSPVYRRFWADSPEERRRKLMPFFWTLVSTKGSIAGNGESGSIVRLRNRLWFSYPGYAEILLGEPHDDVIKSNDAIRNPYATVMETVRERLKLDRQKVATFASWGVFNAIVEHTEGATLANAGVEPLESSDGATRTLNALQSEARPSWEGTRFDAFTFRLAMAHLASARPRFLYIAFDETDDWAHDGRYDRVVDAYARSDGYLEQLWKWLESQPDYRGRTHLLVTTDHGRGRTPKDWRDHGARVEGAGDVWMAFVSPHMKQRGVWSAANLSSGQIAATLAAWMGIDWTADHPNAGTPIR